MSDITALTDKIIDEAKQKAETTLANAKSEALQILAAAEKEADAHVKAIADNAKMQCEAIDKRAHSQAGIEQRNMILSTRRKAIDLAFSLALEKLCTHPEDETVAFLTALAQKYQTGEAELIFNVKDKAIGEKVCKKLCESGIKAALSQTEGTFAGGFIIKEGSIETNCTFEVLIKGVAGELEAEVASVLFA